MLQRSTALIVILVALVLAACGGSGEEAGDGGATATPAPTQAPAATPTTQPTPAAEATSDDDAAGGDEASSDDEASPTPAPTQAASDASEAEATPTADASEAEATPTEEATPAPVDVVEQIRARTEAMWEVYNSHDADALAAFYEPDYWKTEEEEVRDNMRPFRTFGITIRAEETSPPTEIAPGQWEIRQTGHFPLGSIQLAFIWQEFDGVWLLIHTEAE